MLRDLASPCLSGLISNRVPSLTPLPGWGDCSLRFQQSVTLLPSAWVSLVQLSPRRTSLPHSPAILPSPLPWIKRHHFHFFNHIFFPLQNTCRYLKSLLIYDGRDCSMPTQYLFSSLLTEACFFGGKNLSMWDCISLLASLEGKSSQ